MKFSSELKNSVPLYILFVIILTASLFGKLPFSALLIVPVFVGIYYLLFYVFRFLSTSINKKSRLKHAIRCNTPEKIKVFFLSPLGPEKKHELLHFGLLFATETEKLKAAQTLISLGADINQEGKEWSVFSYNCSITCNVQFVKLLIRNGLDLNRFDSVNCTPLHNAITCCFFKGAKIILEEGIPITQKGKNGETIIELLVGFETVEEDFSDILKFLDKNKYQYSSSDKKLIKDYFAS